MKRGRENSKLETSRPGKILTKTMSMSMMLSSNIKIGLELMKMQTQRMESLQEEARGWMPKKFLLIKRCKGSTKGTDWKAAKL